MTTNELASEFKIGDLTLVLSALKKAEDPMELSYKIIGALPFEFHSDFEQFMFDNWELIGL